MRPIVAVALVFLLALQVPGSTSGQSSSTAGLSLTLAIDGPAPQWVDGDPTNTQLLVTVTNQGRGATPYVLTYDWVAPGGSTTPLNGNAQSSTDASSRDTAGATLPLAPQESRTHTMPWSLQRLQSGAGRLRVTATYGNLKDSVENVVFIPSHRMTFTVPGHAQGILPGEVRFFRAHLSNLGNVAETVRLGLADSERVSDGIDNRQLGKTLDPAQATLASGAAMDATLYLERSPELARGPFRAQLTLWMQTPYARNLTATTPALLSNDTAAGYPPGYAFSLDGLPADVVSVPAGGLALSAVLRNLAPSANGTFDDTYRLSTSIDAGWTAVADKARFALAEGEAAASNLIVRSPAGAVAGMTADLNVSAASDHGLPPRWLHVPLRVQGSAIRVADMAMPEPYLGDEADVRVRLVDFGDHATQAGTSLQVTATDAAGQAHTVPALVPALSPGASATLTVHLPAFTAGGPAVLEAVWADPAGQAPSDRATLATVVHDPHLRVLAPTPLEGVAGERVTYWTAPHLFQVRNDGAQPETVVLAASADLGQVLMEGPSTFVLPAGETRSLAVSHVLPLPAGRLTGASMGLSAHVLGRAAVWSASVRTLLVDHDAPVLRLQGTLPSRWTLGEVLPIHVTASDSGQVVGVDLLAKGPSGNVTVPFSLPGREGDWLGGMDFNRTGNYTLRVRARDAAGNVANLTLGTVAAAPVPPPKVAFVGLNATLLADAIVHVAASDLLGIQKVLVWADGHEKVLELAGNGSMQARLSDLDLQAGNYTLHVEAVNLAGARSNATAAVRVLPPPVVPQAERPVTPVKKTPGAEVATVLAVVGTAWLGRRRRLPRQPPST